MGVTQAEAGALGLKGPLVVDIPADLGDGQDEDIVLKLGADDLIPKPFNREDLAQIIERVLSHE